MSTSEDNTARGRHWGSLLQPPCHGDSIKELFFEEQRDTSGSATLVLAGDLNLLTGITTQLW